MIIGVASVFVDDQEKALSFYADVLGFKKGMIFLSASIVGLPSSHRNGRMVLSCFSSRMPIRRRKHFKKPL